LELQRNGVRIFAATHNYNFAKHLEIRRTEEWQVMFHNLYKGTGKLPEAEGNLFPGAMAGIIISTLSLQAEWKI
jgi:hypothetical protein